MQLLHDQVGVVDFSVYKHLFMQNYARSRTAFGAMPGLTPLYGYPHRNYREAGAKAGLPVVGITLATLAARLQVR